MTAIPYVSYPNATAVLTWLEAIGANVLVRARVLDPGGREWSFGTYRPGLESAAWG